MVSTDASGSMITIVPIFFLGSIVLVLSSTSFALRGERKCLNVHGDNTVNFRKLSEATYIRTYVRWKKVFKYSFDSSYIFLGETEETKVY